MCAFSWEQSAFSGCDCSRGNLESRPLSLRAAPLFHQAKLLQDVDYFPWKRGAHLRGTCEGTDSEKERELFIEL